MADTFPHKPSPDTSHPPAPAAGESVAGAGCREEEHFAAYGHLAVPVYVLDQRLQCIHVNDAACDFLGKSRTGLLGQTVSALFPCNDTGPITAEDILAFEESEQDRGASSEATLFIRGKHKHVRFIRQCGRDAKGFRCLVVLLQDASEERGAQERIRALECATSASRDFLSIVNQQFRFEMVNDALCKAHGMERSMLLGRSMLEMTGEDTFRNLRPRLERCLAGERVLFQIWAFFVTLGTRRMDVSYTPMRDRRSGDPKVIICCRDITAQAASVMAPPKPLEDRLGLIERLQHAKILLNSEGRVTMANPAAEELLGAPLSEFKGCRFADRFCIHPEDFCKLVAQLEGLVPLAREQIVLRRGDGSQFQAACTVRTVTSSNGRPATLEVGLETVLEPKSEGDASGQSAQLERRMLLRTSELSKANKLLLDKIHQLEGTKRELHDYRTRLRRLAFELSMVEQRERRRLALELHDGIGQDLAMARIRLSALRGELGAAGLDAAHDELLELIKKMIGQSRGLIWEMGAPDLYDLGFEAALEELAEDFQARRGIATRYETMCPPPLDLGKEQQVMLFQMARELLANVAKHSGAARAAITLDQDENEVRITVEDDGRGMPEDAPVARGSRDSGFGLFSIRERLDLIGGSLRLESRPRQGTRCTLVVPREPLEAMEPAP